MASHTPGSPDTRNILIAMALATLILVGWQYFYEAPRQKAALAAQQEAAKIAQQKKEAEKLKSISATKQSANAMASAPKIVVKTERLHGSISLRGAQFNDLTLAQYHETQAADAPEVKLLSYGTETTPPYVIETGVLAADETVKLPDGDTLWTADKTTLTETQPVTLRWDNGAGLTFVKTIALDDAYMFTVTTKIINHGAAPLTVYPYGVIRRDYADTAKHVYFMHEGPLGVTNNVLEDVSYKTLRNDGPQKLEHGAGWIGLTDKYWLTAIIPEAATAFDATFTHVGDAASEAYQADLREGALTVPAHGEASSSVHVFAGAKEVKRLDAYSAQYNIPLFDRAVDFGSLYFLTKPIFEVLSYFNGIVGNFGLAILLLTVCIKALLFPLAHKSMVAMAHMKLLTPKMKDIRERHAQDKIKMNQEIMALYKTEKVNPMAGCLPILLQIPVFLALYRVLYVTIEMRQAPFFGWIHDLSVPDPTNLFNLFGLIPWTPPQMLHIGVLPLIMCATMVIQQKLNPKPADEIQAMMMTYMPFVFLVMFANFPAGLVLYWAWNNTLTILQQLYINTHLDKKGLRQK